VVDPKLDKNIAGTRIFMDLWVKFYDQMVSARKREMVDSKEEADFLAVKSDLARRHKVLQQGLGQDYGLDTNTMNIVSQAISLDSVKSSSDVAMKKLENEWHRAYISINETLGALENKREEMANVTSFSAAMGNFQKNVLGNKNVMVLLVLIGIAVVIFVMYRANPRMFEGFVKWYKGLLGAR
jgi:predicted RND superfamily exporter protein